MNAKESLLFSRGRVINRIGRPLGPLFKAWALLVRGLEAVQPLAQLAARLYVAKVFFWSGLTKIRDWDVTLALFTDEYKVPLLPVPVAALLGTGGELVLPVLLALGLGGRFAALGLSCVNAVAVLSLPEISDAGLAQHTLWGCLLAGLALWGPGAWSLERWLMQWTDLKGKSSAPL